MAKRILAWFLCVTLLLPVSAWSWGRDGHRIVALIAAKNLTPAVRKKLATILGTNEAGLDKAMAEASTWPDAISKPATKTGNWHFVDVPITGSFAIGTLCAGHDCVIDRIEEMSDRLQNNKTGFKLAQAPSPSRSMTSQELAFLIHFVGDIHQPLHAANDGDRGGNCENLTEPLKHPDGSKTTELHAVWDVDEVLAVMSSSSTEEATAERLFQQFKKGTSTQQLTAKDWAKESNDLAKKDIYQSLKIKNHSALAGQCAVGVEKVAVTQKYLDGNVKDVDTQLRNAGVRLSNILNTICAGQGCEVNPTGRGGR